MAIMSKSNVQVHLLMKKIFILLLSLTALTACNSDDDDEPQKRPTARMTVMVYMAAENNLSSYADYNLNDMVAVSTDIPDDCHLVAFVDQAASKPMPRIEHIANGNRTIDQTFSPQHDFLTSDTEKFRETLKWMMDHYPAREYALILWGHANGWIIMDSVANTLCNKQMGYGIDTGDNSQGTKGTWMNIPSMASALEQLPRLKYIFADCCNFQCVEVAYELRNSCDYLIGSPAEIPGEGAPYRKLMKHFFCSEDSFFVHLADLYNQQESNGKRPPISVIYTPALPSLAQATAKAMATIKAAGKEVITNRLIYYTGNDIGADGRVMYDMNHFMLTNLSEANYAAWHEAYEQTVIRRCFSQRWETMYSDRTWRPLVDFSHFDITQDNYGGMSMFIPLERYDRKGLNYNTTIRQMEWWYAAQLDQLFKGGN